eukprot:2027853-Rhodomonas_salina.2
MRDRGRMPLSALRVRLRLKCSKAHTALCGTHARQFMKQHPSATHFLEMRTGELTRGTRTVPGGDGGTRNVR